MSSSEPHAGGRHRPVLLRWLTAVALLMGAAIIGGCGFHMQGAMRLPEGSRKVCMVTSDELSPFAVELRRALVASGAQLTPSAAGADTVIRVLRDRVDRRVLSVSARNTPREFEIVYVLEYAIDQAGKELWPAQQLELRRNFSFEESQLLAKDREEEILRQAMARDLADLVLRRLESTPRAKSKASLSP
jgi:LPS-assembly lipoprotein